MEGAGASERRKRVMRDRTWVALLAAAAALLAIPIALSHASLGATAFSVGMSLLANFILYTDALDFLLRRYAHWRHTARSGGSRAEHKLSISLHSMNPTTAPSLDHARPYAIVASVFNLEPGLDDFMRAFQSFRERVWLISDGSTDNTVKRLHEAGWRCLDERVNRRKPGALRCLLPHLPPHIETVMVIDPDVRICGSDEGSEVDLERLIGDFQRSGAAAVCPRLKIEPKGFIGRLQAFEYVLAFRLGRESLADYSVTSGIAIYRRDALARVLQEHSLSVYAEDLENAIILLSQSERIYYDGRLVIATEGPATWRRWFSQRVGWAHGLIRVYTSRFQEIRRISRRAPFAMYQYIIYLGILSLGSHLLKIASLGLLTLSLAKSLDGLLVLGWLPRGTASSPVNLATALGGSLILNLITQAMLVPKGERAYTAPIVPLYGLYSLLHVVPISVGFANWIAVTLWGRRLYRDYYTQTEDAIPK